MTFFETSGQGVIFLMLLWAGAGAGISYDLMTPLRKKGPGWLKVSADILFCLMAGGLCAFCLILGGEGKMRAYALLGLFCGGAVYCLGVRSLAAAMIRICLKWIRERKAHSSSKI